MAYLRFFVSYFVQCFDAVGWGGGEHPTCQNLGVGTLAVVVWLEPGDRGKRHYNWPAFAKVILTNNTGTFLLTLHYDTVARWLFLRRRTFAV